VLDGYRFRADFQLSLKSAGCRILVIDDYAHAAHYSADLVLNQNAHAGENMYASRERYTRLLLGTRYCLLRRQFASWRGWKRQIAQLGHKVLVTLGGSDPSNLTELVVDALGDVDDIEVNAVVGGSNPHLDALRKTTSRCGGRVHLQQSATNVPELMAWADISVSGAGSTCWEMCLLQLPMALIDIAENQKPIAQGLQRLQAAVHLGSAESITRNEIRSRVMALLASADERTALSTRCGGLVDGLGAGRVLNELMKG
jgi:spore coat polysaccharide biosynthesis predicted glycosyltransferase SpsG